MLSEFEHDLKFNHKKIDNCHHEQMPVTQKAFANHVSTLVATLCDLGNHIWKRVQICWFLTAKRSHGARGGGTH